MTTPPGPRGRLGEGAHGAELQIERLFDAALADVWAALTESALLERWVGRWEGDPSTGTVTFLMTAEGADVRPETCTITECTPPHRFAADTGVGDAVWHLRFDLNRESDRTRMLFAQAVGSDPLGSIGPGWEYYLDRLERVLHRGDAEDVDFDDYYPALESYYRALEH